MTYLESSSANEKSTRPAAHMPLSQPFLITALTCEIDRFSQICTLHFRGPFNWHIKSLTK